MKSVPKTFWYQKAVEVFSPCSSDADDHLDLDALKNVYNGHIRKDPLSLSLSLSLLHKYNILISLTLSLSLYLIRKIIPFTLSLSLFHPYAK